MLRKSFVALAVAAFVLVAAQASAAPVTLFYPAQASADFSVDVPGEWELEQAEEEGGFFTVNGPTGVQLSFRTVSTDSGDMKAAIEQSVEFVFENYEDVEMGDPEDIVQNGMAGFNMTGTASLNGDPVIIVMAWLALKNDKLAEVMFVVEPSDKPGFAAAERVLKTLRRR